MFEEAYLRNKRDVSNWNVLTNDGVNISAINKSIGESFTGTLTDFYLMLAKAGEFVVQRDDRYTGSKVDIDITHYKMHEGKYFSHTGKITAIAHNATYDHFYPNPSNNYVHFRETEISVLAAPVEIFLYEGTTVSANGTPASVININRASTITNTLPVFHNPTITDLGTQIKYRLITGTAQSGGSVDAQFKEIILKPNTNYLVRLKNISNQATDIAYDSEWYE